MRRSHLVLALAGAALLAACADLPAWMRGADTGMTFFVTSSNPGRGADFGGIEGADRLCQSMAAAVGEGRKTWHAYLSTTGAGVVHARDRIGRGPWRNAKGIVIAANVDELHGTNQISKETALTERGEVIMGRGDAVNMHDILTGSTPDGRATAGGSTDTTCGNWTRSGDGAAIVGHHDRIGLKDDAPSQSWNSSHPSRGCSLAQLKSSGGDGRLYCFAVN